MKIVLKLLTYQCILSWSIVQLSPKDVVKKCTTLFANCFEVYHSCQCKLSWSIVQFTPNADLKNCTTVFQIVLKYCTVVSANCLEVLATSKTMVWNNLTIVKHSIWDKYNYTVQNTSMASMASIIIKRITKIFYFYVDAEKGIIRQFKIEDCNSSV